MMTEAWYATVNEGNGMAWDSLMAKYMNDHNSMPNKPNIKGSKSVSISGEIFRYSSINVPNVKMSERAAVAFPSPAPVTNPATSLTKIGRMASKAKTVTPHSLSPSVWKKNAIPTDAKAPKYASSHHPIQAVDGLAKCANDDKRNMKLISKRPPLKSKNSSIFNFPFHLR